jgi:hypothetical protein
VRDQERTNELGVELLLALALESKVDGREQNLLSGSESVRATITISVRLLTVLSRLKKAANPE